MSCTQEHAEDSLDGEVSAIGWLSEYVRERRRNGQELINLNDGERSIWANVELMQGQNGRVDSYPKLSMADDAFTARGQISRKHGEDLQLPRTER